jgi:hypothetical protein
MLLNDLAQCVRSDCPRCRFQPVSGVLLFGPVLGVSLVERCPECKLWPTDRLAALASEDYLGIKAVACEGRWFLDFLAKSTVEPLIVADLLRLRDMVRTRTDSLSDLARDWTPPFESEGGQS